ncbi:MAG: UDP-glucose/GDP-mannose dehydrogenase family protein [Bacilli bacterium]
MKLAIIGLGYVGLANVAYLVSHGQKDVVAFDRDESKISLLKASRFPFNELVLNDVLKKEAKKIIYTSAEKDLADADGYFVAVGTPSKEDGTADLSFLDDALNTIEKASKGSNIVIRSTVPVGTAKKVADRLASFHVISMPEFLAEGRSYEDESSPYRIVLGAKYQLDFDFIRNLRKTEVNEGVPFYYMSNESAELCKYASNIFLSMKISYINEMARLAEAVGADIDDVAMAMGADPRIGHAMLKAGLGYGGSCFPKDGEALLETASKEEIPLLLPRATVAINDSQPLYFFKKIQAYYPNLKGIKIALLGLAYKAGTSDLRNALSLVLAKYLLASGAVLSAYDPAEGARKAFAEAYPDVKMFVSKDDALKGADALVIVTEEGEFAKLDEKLLLQEMNGRVIFDGRNLYSTRHFHFFAYVSIGRATRKLSLK